MKFFIMLAHTVLLIFDQEFVCCWKAGKKVFVIRRQQVDTPNHCSTWHTPAAAMAYSPAFAGFVILLAVPPHSSRQLLCPSPHFVHFFLTTLDSVSLHPLHSSSIHFSQVQSTRCQYYYARRLAIACVPGFYWHRSWLISMPHKAPSLCTHHPADAGFYWAPQSLALAVRLRFVVPPSLRRPHTGSLNVRP